jgi:hypothetical protein
MFQPLRVRRRSQFVVPIAWGHAIFGIPELAKERDDDCSQYKGCVFKPLEDGQANRRHGP